MAPTAAAQRLGHADNGWLWLRTYAHADERSTRRGRPGETRTSKTPAGVRDVALEGETARVLRAHRLACGRPFDGSPVFADETGNPLNRHGRIRFGLARVVNAAGLDGVTAHVFRHAHASWLADAGVSPTAAAARLGHADGGALFLRAYAHAGERDGAAVIDLLSALRKRVPAAETDSARTRDHDEE